MDLNKKDIKLERLVSENMHIGSNEHLVHFMAWIATHCEIIRTIRRVLKSELPYKLAFSCASLKHLFGGMCC